MADDVRAIAPFVSETHGFALCLETQDGPLLTKLGDVVIFVSGMIHGSEREMINQIDYVMSRAKSYQKGISAYICANKPSFRFPDAVMRKVLKHVEHYKSDIRQIVMVDAAIHVRLGFRFASPFLSDQLRKIIIFSFSRKLDDLDKRPTFLGGNFEFSCKDYIKWRFEVENCDSCEIGDRLFDKKLLETARNALQEAYQTSVNNLESQNKFEGEKKGSGGVFGSKRWKQKTFVVDAGRLIYFDSTNNFSTIELDNVKITSDDVNVLLHSPTRLYEFKLSCPLDASSFVSKLKENSCN